MKVYLEVAEMREDVDKMVAHFEKAVSLRDSVETDIDVASKVVKELDAALEIAASIADGLELLTNTIKAVVVPLADELKSQLAAEGNLPE